MIQVYQEIIEADAHPGGTEPKSLLENLSQLKNQPGLLMLTKF